MATVGEDIVQATPQEDICGQATPQDVKGSPADVDNAEQSTAEEEAFPSWVKKENNILTVWGNKQTMNLNHLVLENIVQSPYYKNKLSEMKMFHELIDEIYYNVQHLEPWEKGTRKTTGQTGMCGGVRGVGAGGVVSTPFCIMYRLFMLKLTRKQVYTMLNHPDSPFIRGVGFMYIRFCLPPATFWDLYERYLEDEEPIDPRAGGGDPITIGQMVKMFLTKLEWYCTLFPRIPVPVQKELDLKMREHNKKVYESMAESAEKEENFEEEKKAFCDDKKRDMVSGGRSKSREKGHRSRSGSQRNGKETGDKRREKRHGSRSGSRRNGKETNEKRRSHDIRRRDRSRSTSRHRRHPRDDERRRHERRSRSRSPSSLGKKSDHHHNRHRRHSPHRP